MLRLPGTTPGSTTGFLSNNYPSNRSKQMSRLESLGVIEPVEYSDWAVPLAKKDSVIRQCGGSKLTVTQVLVDVDQ